MKATKWVGLSLAIVMIAGMVFAEAQQDRARRPERPGAEGRRSVEAARDQTMAGRDQMYRERMARQGDMHRAEIEELLKIKAIAETENATKTAEAIQALIDKKNAEYQKGVQQVEKARREREERLKQRMQRAEQQRQQTGEGTTDPANNETPNTSR